MGQTPQTPKGWQDATFYIQVEPVWSRYTDSDGERSLVGIRAVGLTQKRSSTRNGVVQAKLTLRMPEGAFKTFKPEAVIVVPESMLTTNAPIQVEATDPE